MHKKWSFPLRISSVHLTKSAVSWKTYGKLHLMENFIFCAVLTAFTQDFIIDVWQGSKYVPDTIRNREKKVGRPVFSCEFYEFSGESF